MSLLSKNVSLLLRLTLLYYSYFDFSVFVQKGCDEGAKVFQFVDKMDFFVVRLKDVIG